MAAQAAVDGAAPVVVSRAAAEAGVAAEEALAGHEAAAALAAVVSAVAVGVRRGVAGAVFRGAAAAGAVAAAGFNQLHPSRSSPVLEMGAGSVSLRGTVFRRASISLIFLSGAKTSGRGCHGDLDWLHRRYLEWLWVFCCCISW